MVGHTSSHGIFRKSTAWAGLVPAIPSLRAVLMAAAVVAPVAQAAAQTSDGGAGPVEPATERPAVPQPLTNLRYTEDYSYLRDAAKGTGAWWERFKYIPLDASGSSYLSLGAELRFRQEAYRNFNWGEVPKDDYQWYRLMPYADLHVGPVRVFGQMIASWASGKETPVTGVDETGLELLQGFTDLKLPVGDAAELTLRGGRQLLSYGSERLISLRYGPNVLRSFDGGLASFEAASWRVDAFYAEPVRNKVESFNDRSDGSKSLWSLYATRSLEEISPGSGLDLYYIGYGNDDAAFNQGAGRERRHTLGGRFFGEAGGWDWNAEAMFQFGSFADGDISAWSVASDTGYTFAALPFSPRVGLRANIISGDRDPDDPDLQTFNPLFPKGKYFGEIGLIGPSNLIDLHPNLTITLNDQWTLSGAAVFYWRESLGDGIYDAGGGLVRGSDGSRSRYIGTQADIVLGWQPSRWFSAELSYSVFAPGPFIRDTGQSETAQFVGLETVVKF